MISKHINYVHEKCSNVVRFHLTLNDEGDADHWMFATTAATNLSLNDEKEEEKEEEEVRDDFATPNTDSEPQDFDSIPIIDLSQPKEVYAKQIGDACRNVGFFYIINHGVDQKVMDGIMNMSRNFFDLDLSTKLQVSSNCNSSGKENKKGYRGYFEIGGEDLDNKDGTRDLLSEEGGVRLSNDKATTTTKKGDYKEGYDCGLSNNEDALLFFGDNMWPDEVENPSIVGFREHVNQYQSELIRLSDKLLLALGLCLNDNLNGGSDIAEDYFIKQSRHPLCTLRLLHYPATNDSPVTSSSSEGCGAHTGKSALVSLYHMISCVRYEDSAIWILHLAFISHYLTAFEPHVLT